MNWIITCIILWNGFGVAVLIPILSYVKPYGAVGQADGMEFVNPIFVYKHNRVNWFGAFVVATLYGLVCPVATIGYWIYKLCTIGRR